MNKTPVKIEALEKVRNEAVERVPIPQSLEADFIVNKVRKGNKVIIEIKSKE